MKCTASPSSIILAERQDGRLYVGHRRAEVAATSSPRSAGQRLPSFKGFSCNTFHPAMNFGLATITVSDNNSLGDQKPYASFDLTFSPDIGAAMVRKCSATDRHSPCRGRSAKSRIQPRWKARQRDAWSRRRYAGRIIRQNLTRFQLAGTGPGKSIDHIACHAATAKPGIVAPVCARHIGGL